MYCFFWKKIFGGCLVHAICQMISLIEIMCAHDILVLGAGTELCKISMKFIC